jgi:hypothetical protein
MQIYYSHRVLLVSTYPQKFISRIPAVGTEGQTAIEKSALFICHAYYRHYHFFQAYTAMLKCITVIVYKMIVVVGVAQKNIAFGKNER